MLLSSLWQWWKRRQRPTPKAPPEVFSHLGTHVMPELRRVGRQQWHAESSHSRMSHWKLPEDKPS